MTKVIEEVQCLSSRLPDNKYIYIYIYIYKHIIIYTYFAESVNA